MKAKLKGLWSPDVDLDNPRFDDPESVYCLVEAEIGEENSEGSDVFDFVVCTPKGLETKLEGTTVLSGHGLLIMQEFDAEKIERYLASHCDKTVGKNWSEVVRKLRLIGSWEFEGMET